MLLQPEKAGDRMGPGSRVPRPERTDQGNIKPVGQRIQLVTDRSHWGIGRHVLVRAVGVGPIHDVVKIICQVGRALKTGTCVFGQTGGEFGHPPGDL